MNVKDFLLKKLFLITDISGLIGCEVANTLSKVGGKFSAIGYTSGEDFNDIIAKKHSVVSKNYCLDVANADRVSHVVKEIVDNFTKIDVLISLAAIDAK